MAHAYIKPISDDTYNLGWEDLYDGGDRDCNDVVLNITFVRSTSLDTDGDGLPDYVETHGIMDNLGHTYHTNATDPDTDHDGLTDDEEVGVLKTNANGYIQYSFNVISDPTLKDRDNDGLNDDEELYLGTKPLNKDTDGDTILDGTDPDPLVKDVPDFTASTLETIRIIIGAVFGDTGDFNVVNASINTSGAYDGTDIGAGVSTANNELINHGNRSHVWMMILLSDGYGSYMLILSRRRLTTSRSKG